MRLRVRLQGRMASMSDTDLQRWANNWAATGRALDDVRRRMLQDMTDDDVRRIIAELFSVPCPENLQPRTTSGLVEQQRLFARLRRPA